MNFWSTFYKYREDTNFRMLVEHKEDAHIIAETLPAIWANFVRLTRNEVRGQSGTSNIADILDKFEAAISSRSRAVFDVQQLANSHYEITSEIPLLDQANAESFTPAGFDPWPRVGAILYFWSGFVSMVDANLFERGHPAFGDPRVQRAIAEAASHFETDTYVLESTTLKAREIIKEAQVVLDDKTAEFDAAISRAREAGVFQEARILWANKAREHITNYVAGFIVVILGVFVLAAALGSSGTALWNQLPRNAVTGEYTYLATFVVGLAFLAVAWIFRMIGRFVMDNFILAADARQRQTILETFLNLVGTAEAKMNEGERVLILSALFRAAPGQGSDDPAPASLIDLVKDATKTK